MIVSNQREFDFALKNNVKQFSFAPGNYLLRKEILPLDVSGQTWDCQPGVVFLAVNSGTVLKGENFKLYGNNTNFFTNKVQCLIQLDGNSELNSFNMYDFNNGKKEIPASRLLA